MSALSRIALALVICSATGLASAQSAAPTTVRMRGTIQAVTPTTLTVKDRGGEVVALVLPEKLTVAEVYPIALADIQPGSFIGTAALPQADGSQKAIAITVFPESARGLGEGHRPFDLMPQSTMTNATVAQVSAAASGRRMRLQYQGGALDLEVPEGTPVVSFRPADRSLLVPGASVSLSAQVLDGKPTAVRISAGKNGFQLPY